jgi:hypothetical protein
MQDIEKLGFFYLGRRVDRETGETLREPLLYDSRDLTTHAVCIGMTGSGKTGLCIALLEEAAIDGIPAIAIDPKGDLGNLLLAFPGLDAASFRPWIDEAEAGRAGIDPDEHARRTADSWRNGLAEWDQDGARIERFRNAVEATLYTPGSRIGRSLSVLGCLTAPDGDVLDDAEALAERSETAAAGLLSLLGVQSDPLRSREHVLLSTLLTTLWTERRQVGLEDLVRQVQKPPFERVGALSLESFFPEKDRFALAVSINNLIASPSFAPWREGEPMDVQRLLYTEEGKPRLTIVSVAHLDDQERMFVVALLLNEIVAWVRRQPGSQSLRAVVYMDEMFGFLPPTANPASKKPLLTLLKQARAHGVGIVLATQNPVDLDYKALANAGTWFLGRLQTERDKARVLDGLDSLAGRGLGRERLDALLSSLGKRVFLMHDVHESEPVLLHSRWALSYLAGPLSRDQISRLTRSDIPKRDAATTWRERIPSDEPAESAQAAATSRPVVEPGVEEVFLDPSRPGEASSRPEYRPAIYARARLHFVHPRARVDSWQEIDVLGCVAVGDRAWDTLETVAGCEIRSEPRPQARFRSLPAVAASVKSFSTWSRALAARLHRDRALELYHCQQTGLWSLPGETRGDFVARNDVARREERDRAIEAARTRYAGKVAALTDRVRRADQRIEREREQYESARGQTAISLGTTILGTLFGRKVGSSSSIGRAASTMRGAGRAAQQRSDIARARQDADALRDQLEELEREAQQEVTRIAEEFAAAADRVEAIAIPPRKSDLRIERIALAWVPTQLPLG